MSSIGYLPITYNKDVYKPRCTLRCFTQDVVIDDYVCIVIGFISVWAINVCHHYSCEFDSHSLDIYTIYVRWIIYNLFILALETGTKASFPSLFRSECKYIWYFQKGSKQLPNFQKRTETSVKRWERWSDCILFISHIYYTTVFSYINEENKFINTKYCRYIVKCDTIGWTFIRECWESLSLQRATNGHSR